jgi:cysteinyl-tRNA synthetase
VLHLNTTGGKMSKSKGEFLTVSLLEEKGYDPMVYRFFCLQSHYRKSLVFSWENMDNAAVAYNKLVARVAGLNPDSGEAVDEAAMATLKEGFVKALDNDLNTSLAVTAIYDVLKAKVNDATKLAVLADFEQVLSIGILDRAAALREKQAAEKAAAEAAKRAAQEAELAAAAADPFVAEILAAIEARKAAKKAKNFAEADRIRDELAAKGVTLVDTAQGTTYKIN